MSAPRLAAPVLGALGGVCRSALKSAVAGFDLLSRYHRCEVRGVDKIPDGPALIVANHNGGLNPVDGLFLVEYYRQRGYDQPVYVLAHDILFRIKRVARMLESVGIIQARRGQARSLLEAGHKVLVFPGGDVESMRPFRDRRRIVLAERQGFARLALRSGVPIVPVVSAGSHETMIVLTRGHRLARLMQTHKWARISSLPIILAAPWGLMLGPTCALPYLPLPSKITFQVGAPLSVADHACCEIEAAEHAPRIYSEVEQTMQGMLDSLYDERLLPIFG